MALILVADDDRTTRALLCAILEEDGHSVVEAADGKQAVLLAGERPFDVAFIDVFMPERDGIQTAKTIAAEHPGMRLVAMSGGSTFTATESLKWAKRYCARRLTKPFTEEQIQDILRELLA